MYSQPSTKIHLLNNRLEDAGRVWLFLDYDGTLAEFAPTPDEVIPDQELIDLLKQVSHHPAIRLAIISGRRLKHIRTLLPVPDVILNGTYGIEWQTPDGELMERLNFNDIRPALETLKPQWEAILEGKEGFYLEDKRWSLAIHARLASEDDADQVLAEAEEIAEQNISLEPFRILGGHRFLEIGPKLANKGQAVSMLLEKFPWEGSIPVFVGDDDKDEEAFDVIQNLGGIAVVVAADERPSHASFRLKDPTEVRRWLESLLELPPSSA